ncbi:MAG TPA: M50 family metallopeptidase [Ktedonobacteraceae bacterium]|nr:M50 family metallopeptidase [Ktedonobacteraceae bacterium]
MMSTVLSPASFKPRLRADILFGPPELSYGTTMYYMKDSYTQWFYRIGAREYFVLSRMDGSRTLEEISAEYEAKFGRRLDQRAWTGLFKLLGTRQLLSDGVRTADLEKLKQDAERHRKTDSNGLFHWRLKLVNPDALLDRLLPWFRFAFAPAFVAPALAAILALEVFVLLHKQTIGADVQASIHGQIAVLLFALSFALFWLIAVLHETAHGLACKRFGGSVREMGIVWRYLSFFPYCTLDDIVLFHNRWHRVYAACAGTFLSLLALLPFAVLWWVSPEKSLLRDLSAMMLLLFNVASLMNLIPFIELDGYFMLSHAINIIDLRKEAQRFCLASLWKFLFKKGAGTTGYGRQGRLIYPIYGLLSLVFTAAFVVLMAYYWFNEIRPWLGNVATWSLLAGVALLFLLDKGPGLKRVGRWGSTLPTRKVKFHVHQYKD